MKYYRDDKCGPSSAIMFQQQEHIQEGEMQSRLIGAFRNLSAVSKVSYADLFRISRLPGDQNEPSYGHYHHSRQLWRRVKVAYKNIKFGICCLKPEHDLGCTDILHKPRDVRSCDFRRRQGGLKILMQVLSEHVIGRLTHLSLGDKLYACGSGGVSHLFFTRNTHAITHRLFLPVFRNVRNLDLTITKPPMCLQSVDLMVLLRSAEYLEELKLVGDMDVAYLRADNTLANHTWRNLQAIHLHHFTASQWEVEDILKRHAGSLRRATLDGSKILHGSWVDVGADIATILPDVKLLLSRAKISHD